MNIQDASVELLHEIRREQPHKAGQAYQIDVGFLQHSDYLSIVHFALEALGGKHASGNLARGSAFQAGSVFPVTDDESDARVRDSSRGDAIRQRLKIRAASA